MLNTFKYATDWHTCFPLESVDHYAFQRRFFGPVKVGPTLFHLPVAWLRPQPWISPPGDPLFMMSQKASHTPVTVAGPAKSQNPAVVKPPLIPLVNEHVQSTHWVSLKPDHINQDLNFKGQVPSQAAWKKNMELLK